MDPAEYLAIVPLLIYGIGITELLGQWKRFFNKGSQYLLYILFTIILTEVAVYNVVIYIDVVNILPQLNYFKYLSYLIPPILFLIVVSIFTPDEGSDTKEYFKSNTRLIFFMITIFVASHFLYDFDEAGRGYLRIVMIFVLLAIAIFKKQWMMYLAAFLWLISLITSGGMLVS